jgi:hypothetical protein
MEIKRVEIRFATSKDLIEFYGRAPIRTVRAIVAESDGRIIGVAGVRLVDMAWYAFADITQELTKKQIAKGIRIFKKMMAGTDLPLYTTRDESIESSERFLAHLGFVKTEDGEYLCQD